jgi:GNAT superfamily N-acetyltransferase
MPDPCTIVEHLPTVEAYGRLIAAVGFRPRRREAIELALQHSWFSVCAESAGEAVGMGRVIGDGGPHRYLTDVIVHPASQWRGVGTVIAAALTAWVDAGPFPNTVIGLLPTPDPVDFYLRHGDKPQLSDSPAMLKWVNPRKDL